jgi:hypothetical protein
MLGVDQKLGVDGDELEDNLIAEVEIVPENCTFDDDNPDNDIIEDYKFIRNKLRYSVAACERVLGVSLKELMIAPSPRGVEGCSTIIKTITECTDQLLSIHDKVKKMKPRTEPLESASDGDDSGKEKTIKATINDIIHSFEEPESDTPAE